MYVKLAGSFGMRMGVENRLRKTSREKLSGMYIYSRLAFYSIRVEMLWKFCVKET